MCLLMCTALMGYCSIPLEAQEQIYKTKCKHETRLNLMNFGFNFQLLQLIVGSSSASHKSPFERTEYIEMRCRTLAISEFQSYGVIIPSSLVLINIKRSPPSTPAV